MQRCSGCNISWLPAPQGQDGRAKDGQAQLSKTKSVADLRWQSREANTTRDHWERARWFVQAFELNLRTRTSARLPSCHNLLIIPWRDGAELYCSVSSRSLHQIMQKWCTHNLLWVQSVRKELGLLCLQSKRMLTATSQSPCLFITHPLTLCYFDPSLGLSFRFRSENGGKFRMSRHENWNAWEEFQYAKPAKEEVFSPLWSGLIFLLMLPSVGYPLCQEIDIYCIHCTNHILW